MKEIIENHLGSALMKDALETRNLIKKCVNFELLNQGFMQIDTPIFSPNVPEYTNNQYVVNGLNGERYYLPQSPQLYKQALMSAGYKKYYQFAHCFRYGEYDENHMNEFMQIDVEMQTNTRKDLMNCVEKIIRRIFLEKGIVLDNEFPVISGEECWRTFGSDKPDLRQIKDEFRFLWIVDLPLLESERFERIKVVSANVKLDNEKYILSHHAFAQPLNWNDIENNGLEKIKTDSFDLVLNGIEICSGDMRINNPDLQREIFDKLNINTANYEHYLKILNPHITNGGFAIGLERLTMAMLGVDDVKKITPFIEGWY